MSFDLKSLQQMTPQDILNMLKGIDKKTWIKIGIGTAVGAFLLVFVVWPAWITRMDLKNKIRALETQVNSTQNLMRKQPEFLKIKEEYSQTIKNAKERLYEPGGSALLLGPISKLAQDSKVTVVASAPKNFDEKFPAPFADIYEGSVYDFVTEGGYHNMGQFVSKIESNPKILRIQTFSLKPREEASDSHLANITLTAISFKKPKAAA